MRRKIECGAVVPSLGFLLRDNRNFFFFGHRSLTKNSTQTAFVRDVHHRSLRAILVNRNLP